MSQQLLTTPSRHGKSLVAVADHVWSLTSNAFLGLASIPLARVAETAIVSLLGRITTGRLRILTPSTIYSFPPPASSGSANSGDDGPQAELRVIKDSFWIRLLTMSDLGFAEAYMYGEVDCDDLVAVFKVFLCNRESLGGLEDSFTSWVFSIPQTLTSYRFLNTISNSRSNISAHYDISNAMFEAFLSEDMTYSCGIFDTLDGDLKASEPLRIPSVGSSSTPSSPRSDATLNERAPLNASTVRTLLNKTAGADELHESQLRKIRHILKKADIRPGHRVLEIGSGWGSLAILAVQETGCEVDTITLSVHQQSLAQERIAKAGLSDSIRVHLVDYRNLPKEWTGAFDRVVSVEMIEAVGAEFLDTYWKVVGSVLKPRTGVAVVQVITLPEARLAKYMKEVDFIRKWVSRVRMAADYANTDNTDRLSIVFPGGFLPTVTMLVQSINRGSSGRLVVDSISNIGPHYARTLREWQTRFNAKFESDIVPALKAEHPDVMLGPRGQSEIEVFRRKWLYYFTYCEVGFTTKSLGDHIVTITREGNEPYSCIVVD